MQFARAHFHHWKYGGDLPDQIYEAAVISDKTGKDNRISYQKKAKELFESKAYVEFDRDLM